HYEHIDRDWAQQRVALDRMLARGRFDDVWSAWESNAAPADALILDPRDANTRADALAEASVNLSVRGDVPIPALDLSHGTGAASAFGISIPPPSEDEWARIADAGRNADEAAGERTRAR